MARRRDPADQRREGPGRAADDDVLRRPPLQPDGVDQDIEQDLNGQDDRREMIGGQIHQDHREDAKADTEVERRLARHPPGGKRP